MMNLPPLTFEDLLALGRRVRVPQAMPDHEPAVGDVWRARWDDESALVLVLEVVGARARVAPCTLDIADWELDGLPLLESRPLYVGWSASRTIPAITLDACFGTVSVVERTAIDEDTEALDERLAAELAPLSTPQLAGEGDGSLPGLLASRSIQPSQLAADLDIPTNTALAIRRGKKPVTPLQARRLAHLLGISEHEVLHGNPRLPDDLAEALHEHRHRAQLRDLASRRRLNDSEAWSTAAYGTLLTAARHTGGRENGWHLRIDRFFDSEGIRDA